MDEEDITGDVLTYEKDILPMRNYFFDRLASHSSIDPVARARASSTFGKELLGSFAERSKAQEMGEANKTRRLQYEAAVLTLDKARDDAFNRRQMMETFEPFQKDIESILADPSLDSSERKRQLNIYGVKNAKLMEVNDVAAKAFATAQNAVGDDDKKKLTVFDYVRAGGDTKYLQEINPDVAQVDLNQEINPAWMLDRLNKSGIAKERAKEDFEREQERKKKAVALMDETLKDIKTIKLAEPKFGKEGVEADTFDDASSEYKAMAAIEYFGTPEERELFAKSTSAREKLRLVQQAGLRQSKLGLFGEPAPATSSSASSLFTSQKKQPEITISPFVD